MIILNSPRDGMNGDVYVRLSHVQVGKLTRINYRYSRVAETNRAYVRSVLGRLS